MVAILLGVARFAIQLGIITGLTALLNRTIFALLDYMRSKTVQATLQLGGYSQAEAEAAADEMVQNAWFDAARDLGVGAALLHAKIPQAATERIGLTSKGWKTPTRVGKSGEAVGRLRGTGPVIIGGAAPTIQTATEVAVKAGRGTFAAISAALTFIVKIVSIPVGILFTAAQFIDFAAWNSSAYQSTFQRVLSKLAALLGQKFEPDKPYPRATAVSSEIFDKLDLVYREEKVAGIQDPYKGVTVPYNRQNLIDLVDKVGAHLLSLKGSASFKEVLAATHLFMSSSTAGFGVKVPATTLPGATPTGPGQAPSAGVGGVAPAPVAPPQVLIGVVSQGTLGAPLTFVSRESDLIESTDELRSAAQNNLVPYVASLLGRIAYEIRIVPSVVTREGFRQYGSAQRIVSSLNKDGTPRYKTVTNRFAVLTLYFIGPGGKRLKLDTITLGPTDAVKLQPTGAQLAQLEVGLQGSVFTTDVGQVTGVAPTQPTGEGAPVQVAVTPSVPVSAPPTLTQAVPTSGPGAMAQLSETERAALLKEYQRGAYNIVLDRLANVEQRASDPGNTFELIVYPWGNAGIYGEQSQFYQDHKNSAIADVKKLRAIGVYLNFPNAARRLGVPEFLEAAPSGQAAGPTGGSAAGQTPTPAPSGACAATTLSGFYTSQGKALPTVAERSKLYADLTLGPAAYYTGTAEQNVKLLAALKAQLGCTS